jgi:spore cortex formation protein SpoVR/YcgB (stage V sporulation)
MCLEPHNCIRRGNEETDKLRAQIAEIEANDEDVCDEEVEELVDIMHALEEHSRNDRRECCGFKQFACRSCLEQHMRHAQYGNETCHELRLQTTNF